VEHGKFWTAWQLAQRGTDFVFFEMDVWLVAPLGHSLFSLHYPSSYASREQLGLRLHQGQLGNKPPLTLVDRDHHARQGVGSGSKSGAAVAAPNLVADLLVSTHQDVPFSLNIGFFSVQGNPKTASFFARLLSKLAADPSLKDQRVSLFFFQSSTRCDGSRVGDSVRSDSENGASSSSVCTFSRSSFASQLISFWLRFPNPFHAGVHQFVPAPR